MLSSWLHLLSLTVYFGCLIGLWLILLPAVAATAAHDGRLRLLSRGLKLYNPAQIGALGFIVLSGAFRITELKSVYREMFLKQVGMPLVLKLALSFVLIVLSVHQAMGVGHRFVKRYEAEEPISATDLGALIGRLKRSTPVLLLLALAALWLSARRG